MNTLPEESKLFTELDELLSQGKLLASHLKDVFKHYSDIQYPPPPKLATADKLIAFYCEGMIDKTELNLYFTKVCHYICSKVIHSDEETELSEELPLWELKHSLGDMLSNLFRGGLIVYREGATYFWVIYLSKVPQRAVEESNTEISIKGPKDAFTEDIYTNLSLIRKRLQTEMLYSEQFTVGSLSKTRVALIYLSHKADPQIIAEARRRLESIELETLISSGQLEQWVSSRTFSLFPLIDHIGRPDFVIETLLRGRFSIIVDGSPMVLIGPSNFFQLLKSPEDVHFPYYFVMFQRVLRIMGIMLSIFLPGFWIAIATVNLDQIPFTLLATVVISREGVPLPSFLESLLLLFQFELLREAGVRLPKAVGQTIGIVGGLIIGDSLIRAGLASPTLLVVIAIAVVGTFSLVNQSLSGTVSLLRFFILIVSSFLGIYGFFLSMFMVLVYVCKLDSFGIAYMEPVASLRMKDMLSALLMDPFRRKRTSSSLINKRKR